VGIVAVLNLETGQLLTPVGATARSQHIEKLQLQVDQLQWEKDGLQQKVQQAVTGAPATPTSERVCGWRQEWLSMCAGARVLINVCGTSVYVCRGKCADCY
jgi:hypothetical protein